MKRLLLFTVAVFLSINSSAQSNITGIGRFKIGMGISIIDSLKSEGYVLETYNKNDKKMNLRGEDLLVARFERKGNKKKTKAALEIYEKPYSSNYTDYGELPLIQGKRKFIVRYCDIAGIDIDYMELSFFDDKLYCIQVSENAELNVALETKYDSNIEEELGKKVSCYNAYRSVDLQEVTYKRFFRKDNITAYILSGTSYYSCKEIFINFFIIEDAEIYDKVNKSEYKVFMDGYKNPNREELNSLKKL